MKSIRETTFEERATWGECPVCNAPDGQWCSSAIGIQLGQSVSGNRLKDGDGVHLARLQRAPMRVQLVPA